MRFHVYIGDFHIGLYNYEDSIEAVASLVSNGVSLKIIKIKPEQLQ